MNEFRQAVELAQWQAPFRKPVHFFWWVQDQEQTVDLILPIFCLYKNGFLYWCDDLVFSGWHLSQNYDSSETHGWLSPDPLFVITLLAELAFCQLVAHMVIPSPISQAKQLTSMLDPGHTAAPLHSFPAFQLGFRSVEKSWTNVKILKFFPKQNLQAGTEAG